MRIVGESFLSRLFRHHRFLACLLLGISLTGHSFASDEDFPEPEAMRSAFSFWTRVYLEVTTDGGLLHDARNLGVVYETIRFNGRKGKKTRQNLVDKRRKYWKAILNRLATGKPPLNEKEETIVRLLELDLGRPPTGKDFRRAARSIRFQLGQRDKFRAGLARSGAYESDMRATFEEMGLPPDLAYLPHVESSFNISAYSKYGAAGVWQFMRSTGRLYLEIDYIVDERLDPKVSTHAAARLLRDNYKALGEWPLALTAYNHGAAGMKRAVRRLKTKDIAAIVNRYRSRTFGFASRNFYAQFIAARRIMHSYESYFGPLQRDIPEPVDEVTLPFYADINDLKTHLNLSPETIKHYNPALRPPVFRSGKRIPKNYTLRLPAGTVGPDFDTWIAQVPTAIRHGEQHASRYYQVRRGDTLGRIAGRHRTRVSTLVSLNNLPSSHRIYPGQVLQLPDRGGSKAKKKPAGLVKTANAATPKPKPKPSPKPIAKATPPPVAPVPVAAEALAATPEPSVLSAAITKVDPVAPPIPEESPWRRLEDDWIIVDTDETLGHFADWLNLPASKIRALNRLSSRQKLRMGRKLHLDFSRVSAAEFLERRIEFHKSIEEDFFGTYRVTGTREHELKRGESLWILSTRVYKIPTWLIQRYNPEISITQLKPGSQLQIPVVERIDSSS